MHEDPNKPDSIWNSINRVFEWLPVGSIIDNKILAVHGGIGKSIKSVQDIANLPRPLEVAAIPQTEKVSSPHYIMKLNFFIEILKFLNAKNQSINHSNE